jgi:hypothetical protein
MNRALPLLASNDTRATLEFYVGLGFSSRGAPPEEWDYLIIESDGCELHFAGHTLGARTPGSAFSTPRRSTPCTSAGAGQVPM